MEERRSSGRTDSDRKVMGKAVNRAKYKNLEIVVGIIVLPNCFLILCNLR